MHPTFGANSSRLLGIRSMAGSKQGTTRSSQKELSNLVQVIKKAKATTESLRNSRAELSNVLQESLNSQSVSAMQNSLANPMN